jgi:hypothetical protein
MNLPRAKADNGNRQHSDQPVKITQFTSLQDGNHKSVRAEKFSLEDYKQG